MQINEWQDFDANTSPKRYTVPTSLSFEKRLSNLWPYNEVKLQNLLSNTCNFIHEKLSPSRLPFMVANRDKFALQQPYKNLKPIQLLQYKSLEKRKSRTTKKEPKELNEDNQFLKYRGKKTSEVPNNEYYWREMMTIPPKTVYRYWKMTGTKNKDGIKLSYPETKTLHRLSPINKEEVIVK